MGESVKKGKFMTEIFFQKMLNEVLKSCKKMMFTDVKADVKQQEVKEPVAVSCIFL